jgi:ComF family protein
MVQKEHFYRIIQSNVVFVPIPLHKAKLRKRGYNQAELLARGLGRKFGIRVVDCLERVKSTKTQVGFSQKERAENIKGAFAVKQRYQPSLKAFEQIILIDDVLTSGATLKEAAKVLKKAGGGKVFALTLAHGE